MQQLGSGVHGTVYAIDHRHACKVIELDELDGESGLSSSFSSSMLREMSALQCLKRSQYVVDCVRVELDHHSARLTMDRYQCDLKQWMQRNPHIPSDQIRSIVYQVLRGLQDAQRVWLHTGISSPPTFCSISIGQS